MRILGQTTSQYVVRRRLFRKVPHEKWLRAPLSPQQTLVKSQLHMKRESGQEAGARDLVKDEMFPTNGHLENAGAQQPMTLRQLQGKKLERRKCKKRDVT